MLYLSAIIINTVAISFPFISMIIYARLLLAIYCFKTIKKSPELSLFYFKFGLDLVISVISFFKLILYALVMTNLEGYFFEHHYLTFFMIWPVSLLTAMRGTLLFIIALDRTFATYFPIKFFKYRKLIPTLAIVSCVLSYIAVDAVIVFQYCRPDLNVPTTCVNAMCVLEPCYQNYSLAFQQIAYSLIVVLAVLLCIKLYIWNKYKKQNTNHELKRANRLAMIDCWIIVFFDLIPPIVHTVFPDFFDYVGALNSVSQTLGFVVESYLCTINVQNKYQMKTGSGTVVRSLFMDTSGIH